MLKYLITLLLLFPFTSYSDVKCPENIELAEELALIILLGVEISNPNEKCLKSAVTLKYTKASENLLADSPELGTKTETTAKFIVDDNAKIIILRDKITVVDSLIEDSFWFSYIIQDSDGKYIQETPPIGSRIYSKTNDRKKAKEFRYKANRKAPVGGSMAEAGGICASIDIPTPAPYGVVLNSCSK